MSETKGTEKAEKKEIVKSTLMGQKSDNPTAHVPITLAELKEHKILEKMGITEEEVGNADVNAYVRKAIGLPQKMRLSGMSDAKKGGIKDVTKALKGMTEDELMTFAKKNNIVLAKPEDKKEDKKE